MTWENRNFLRPASGLLPKGMLELGLDDEGTFAWCMWRGRDRPIALIDTDVADAQGRLARDLIDEHAFAPFFAVEAARVLFAEHRRRSARH